MPCVLSVESILFEVVEMEPLPEFTKPTLLVTAAASVALVTQQEKVSVPLPNPDTQLRLIASPLPAAVLNVKVKLPAV